MLRASWQCWAQVMVDGAGYALIPLSINQRLGPGRARTGRVGSGRMVSYLATFYICLG